MRWLKPARFRPGSGDLPSRVVVYLLLAVCLFEEVGYCGGVAASSPPAWRGWRWPSHRGGVIAGPPPGRSRIPADPGHGPRPDRIGARDLVKRGQVAVGDDGPASGAQHPGQHAGQRSLLFPHLAVTMAGPAPPRLPPDQLRRHPLCEHREQCRSRTVSQSNAAASDTTDRAAAIGPSECQRRTGRQVSPRAIAARQPEQPPCHRTTSGRPPLPAPPGRMTTATGTTTSTGRTGR